MKHYFTLFCALFTSSVFSQTYNGQNISLVSVISPNTSTLTSPVGNKYSGCWAWYQASKNKEYAISGASNGTYFIDISNPGTPSVSAFVSGKQGCTWREMKTYKNYCYIASDDASPNTFQIVDMQYLPDSVHVIHNGKKYFERAHTLWVDSNKLYAASVTYTNNHASMAVFSLATPTAPVLLHELNEDIGFAEINHVHDMYARNDTIFASAGFDGLYILKHDLVNDTFLTLGTYLNYSMAGYNHSGYLTKNGKYFLFCDEVPSSLPIHMVDVQNLSNIQPLGSFFPRPLTTPHNPYLIGDKYAIVSCYQDGLYIYDISQPSNIKMAGYFDTYPQGGHNTGSYAGGDYRGNWGAYPWLPSKLIVANDMQNGVLILNAAAAYSTTATSPVNYVGIEENNDPLVNFVMFPNPAKTKVSVNFPQPGAILQVRNTLGQLMMEKKYEDALSDHIDVSALSNGIYLVTLLSNNKEYTRRLTVQHE